MSDSVHSNTKTVSCVNDISSLEDVWVLFPLKNKNVGRKVWSFVEQWYSNSAIFILIILQYYYYIIITEVKQFLFSFISLFLLSLAVFCVNHVNPQFVPSFTLQRAASLKAWEFILYSVA